MPIKIADYIRGGFDADLGDHVLSNLPDSDVLHGGFGWSIPATFNFGKDVIDARAIEADGDALISEDAAGRQRRYRYSDIARETDRVGAMLQQLGIRKGDRILVMLPRMPEWLIAIVGAMKIGAVPIPCIEMLTARDIAYRVKNSEARAAICRAEHSGKFDVVGAMIPIRISIGSAPGWLELEEGLAAAPEKLDAAVMEAEDPAIMYYTSGSTGEPKAVVHSARGIFAWRNSAIHWLDLKPFDRIWCTADTGWSKAGTSILFGPWSCGATTFIFDGPFVPANRLELLAKHRIQVYCAPGAELYRVAQEDVSRYDLSSLRRTVSAGEVVSPVVAQRWEKATGIRVDEAYGQTETLMLVWNSPDDDLVYGSMGHPAPGCDVAPIDAAGFRCPVGCEGDLALLTPNPQMMLGYWREPNRTAASFRDGPEGRWYVTGDRALVDARGYLFYRGRADDVINSAGYRIGPWEVENVLMEHPAVAQCAVVGSPDEERGEVVKAFIVLRDGIEPHEALKVDIQTHAKSNTAPYKYPRRVEFVQTLPMTPTGKIRRRDLREQERNRLTNRSSG